MATKTTQPKNSLPSFKSQAVLLGRAANNPKVILTKNGKKVVKFALAVPESNELNAPASFFNITCFGKIAENAEKYIKKGKTLRIAGRLAVDSWEKDGIKHHLTYIIANKTEYLTR